MAKRHKKRCSASLQFSSVQFSRLVMSDSLWTHGLQHTRPPCLSPTPGVSLNSCPLSQWGHPTISSSVVPFSSHLQSFPVSGSFQMSPRLFPPWTAVALTLFSSPFAAAPVSNWRPTRRWVPLCVPAGMRGGPYRQGRMIASSDDVCSRVFTAGMRCGMLLFPCIRKYFEPESHFVSILYV